MFKLLELTPIHRGGLLARCKIELTSGMTMICNVLRAAKDPSKIFVAVPAEKLPSGGYTQLIDFANPELRDKWQAAALAALKPRWDELMSPPGQRQAANGGGHYGEF